jgi:hypothetical protein
MIKNIIPSLIVLLFYYTICSVISNTIFYENWNNISNFIFIAGEFGMFIYLMRSINYNELY